MRISSSNPTNAGLRPIPELVRKELVELVGDNIMWYGYLESFYYDYVFGLDVLHSKSVLIFPVLTVPKVLTGADTVFGAHLLSLLHKDYRRVKKVYCLLRPEPSADGIVRAAIEPIYRSLREQNLAFSSNDSIEGIFADTSEENLDLGTDTYRTLCENVTIIIDAASIGSFYNKMSRGEDVEDRHLKSIHNLIQLSLDVPTALSAPLFHLLSSVVGYEPLVEVQEDEVHSSANTRPYALPKQTFKRLNSLLVSAYETNEARTFTIHMPQVSTLPIQTANASDIAAKALEYILDGARVNEDGNTKAFVEKT
ncbi:MAG: hypothetical protein Q9195_000478 [Heterodermia aff. obscurata]